MWDLSAYITFYELACFHILSATWYAQLYSVSSLLILAWLLDLFYTNTVCVSKAIPLKITKYTHKNLGPWYEQVVCLVSWVLQKSSKPSSV